MLNTNNSPNYDALLKNRFFFKVPVPSVRSTSAKRLPMYSHPPVYTRVNRSCPIKKLKLYQAKQAIKSWLMNLTYTNTEPILPTNDYDMLNHNFPHSTHSPTHIHTQKLTHTYNFNLSITHNHVSRCCLSLIIVTISFCLLLFFFFLSLIPFS